MASQEKPTPPRHPPPHPPAPEVAPLVCVFGGGPPGRGGSGSASHPTPAPPPGHPRPLLPSPVAAVLPPLFFPLGHLRWKQWIKKLQFIINIQGSFDEIAIVAGGCDKNGQVLKSAELYNSETGHWETLADMNLARRLSSSFFLDGFYRCKVAYDIALNRPVVCGEWPMYATEISFVWPCWLSQPFDMFGKV
uniref:Uncharacterized protein n=1 Tax=Oryza nivara TaxID=4536 RepID=A0A0E0GCJ3_ORYNI